MLIQNLSKPTLNRLPNLAPAFITGITLLAAFTAEADSAKIKWQDNGHFYQRFERKFTWNEAKNYCENLSAHLATITSEQENLFIINKVLIGTGNLTDYYLGASDAANEGVWQWITGETWDYNYWNSGEPQNRDGEDYAKIFYSVSSSQGRWLDGFGDNNATGFICEWSESNFVGSAIIPDLNANASHEIAGLYVDYRTSKHIVKIKDSLTRETISTLSFATDDHPPSGVVSVADLNGNGIPEIAVLYFDTTTNMPKVEIKDAKNNKRILKKFNVLGTGYVPRNITATPDTDNNGKDELSIIGIDNTTGKAKSETRDSNGQLIGKVLF